MTPTLPGCPTSWGVHSPRGHDLQPPTPLAGHECKKSFLALMAVKSKQKWNALVDRFWIAEWMLSKNIFFVASFLCRDFQPFWLERQRHYFKTFRVLEINKWGRLSSLFSSSTKGQKPPHLDADTEREHRWVLFCVSSSTQSVSWWQEGIWEERIVKQL